MTSRPSQTVCINRQVPAAIGSNSAVSHGWSHDTSEPRSPSSLAGRGGRTSPERRVLRTTAVAVEYLYSTMRGLVSLFLDLRDQDPQEACSSFRSSCSNFNSDYRSAYCLWTDAVRTCPCILVVFAVNVGGASNCT